MSSATTEGSPDPDRLDIKAQRLAVECQRASSRAVVQLDELKSFCAEAINGGDLVS